MKPPILSPAKILAQMNLVTKNWIEDLESLGNKAAELRRLNAMSETQWAEVINILQVAKIVRDSFNG